MGFEMRMMRNLLPNAILINGGMRKITWRVKVKKIPLQAWTHPEGSRRMRLPDFKTMGT